MKEEIAKDNSISVNLQEPATPNKKYFCKRCNRQLFYREQDKETGKHIWICTFDNIEVIPDNELTKKATRFEYPEGSDPNVNKDIPIASIEDPNSSLSSTTFRKQKLPASFQALEKAGFKFVRYEER
jgi:hypothetical protein